MFDLCVCVFFISLFRFDDLLTEMSLLDLKIVYYINKANPSFYFIFSVATVLIQLFWKLETIERFVNAWHLKLY